MTKFIGRKREFNSLKDLLHKQTASLVVLRGRRRIGKSRLAEEFASLFKKTYILTGIPPEKGDTKESQRKEFLRQMQEYRLPIYRSDDWGNLFSDLAKCCQEGRVLVVLDEITWMGSKDPSFLPKLKTAWDLHFKKNPKFIMIISGSNASWISKNILNSTGFFGRVSLQLHLKEFSLPECDRFWDNWPGTISAYEKFKMLSVTGGVPRYLEELLPSVSAEANLNKMCFHSEGLLFNEFDALFHDLFFNKGEAYKIIIKQLVEKPLSMTELAAQLEKSTGGDLSAALDELVKSGFVTRDYTWSLASAQQSTTSTYRVCDNYCRFYLKYIYPHRQQIEAGHFSKLPNSWDLVMGLQLKNLVVSNGPIICKMLNIPSEEIVFANPYLQTPRTRRQGCQIDFLVQTRYHCLYVCEVKFHKDALNKTVITQMEQKLNALQLPRGFSCRPVLIHVNGVNDEVSDSGFFSRIIDFSELLQA